MTDKKRQRVKVGKDKGQNENLQANGKRTEEGDNG